MKYLFIVQGEGRGHMTQAIALSQILRANGDEIVSVIVGKSKKRELPGFFSHDKFFDIHSNGQIHHLESPNFQFDKDHKSVKPLKTVFFALLRTLAFRESLRKMRDIVNDSEPDVIINFYDFLGGLYSYAYKYKARFVCLAHQYLTAHPEFEFPGSKVLGQRSMKLANKITAYGADKILALSFRDMSDLPDENIIIVPPLLRSEVKSVSPSKGSSILIYMVNPGYGVEVENFHQKYPDIPLDCFWDKKDEPEEKRVDSTLTFHRLNDKKFIEKMAECRGYITTAGFESVCEAMYLGKPVMMIPVKGHFEQACNAIDGVKSGAGIQNDEFNIKKLVDYLPDHTDIAPRFRPWADRNVDLFLEHLTET